MLCHLTINSVKNSSTCSGLCAWKRTRRHAAQSSRLTAPHIIMCLPLSSALTAPSLSFQLTSHQIRYYIALHRTVLHALCRPTERKGLGSRYHMPDGFLYATRFVLCPLYQIIICYFGHAFMRTIFCERFHISVDQIFTVIPSKIGYSVIPSYIHYPIIPMNQIDILLHRR
jgi:hypothetical protein